MICHQTCAPAPAPAPPPPPQERQEQEQEQGQGQEQQEKQQQQQQAAVGGGSGVADISSIDALPGQGGGIAKGTARHAQRWRSRMAAAGETALGQC